MEQTAAALPSRAHARALPVPKSKWRDGETVDVPLGRRGHRQRIERRFLADLNSSYAANGREALERCWQSNPMDMLRLVASLLPKETMHTEIRRFEAMDDSQLVLAIEQRVREYRAAIEPGDATALPDASSHDAVTIDASPIPEDGSDLAA